MMNSKVQSQETFASAVLKRTLCGSVAKSGDICAAQCSKEHFAELGEDYEVPFQKAKELYQYQNK